MKLWYVEGEQDVLCMVTYVYELVLLPGGAVRLPCYTFEPDLWPPDYTAAPMATMAGWHRLCGSPPTVCCTLRRSPT